MWPSLKRSLFVSWNHKFFFMFMYNPRLFILTSKINNAKYYFFTKQAGEAFKVSEASNNS